MFEFSGKKLIESFIKKSLDQTKMLFCTENYEVKDTKIENVMFENIGNYEYLTKWLEENKDDIPIQLGGLYDYTQDSDAKKKNMIPGKMNYKASLWFRKVASLHYAYHKYIKTGKFNILIWVDSDCFFVKNFNKIWAINLFKGKNGFVMMGKRRLESQTGVESGLWGIRNKFTFLEDLFRMYDKKRYKRSLYWGDGHVMGFLLRSPIFFEKYNIIDLAKGSKNSNVMTFIKEIKNFIVHTKGLHFAENIDYKKDHDPQNLKKFNSKKRKKQKQLNELKAIEKNMCRSKITTEILGEGVVVNRKTPRINKSQLQIKYGQLSSEDD